MSLTTTTSIDKITVTENGAVLYREAKCVMENDSVLNTTYHRSSLTPGQDLTNQPAQVVAICNTAWTPEVIAAYRLALELPA